MRGAARSIGGEAIGIRCTKWENLMDAKALDFVAAACRPPVVPFATESHVHSGRFAGASQRRKMAAAGAWRMPAVGGFIVPPLHPGTVDLLPQQWCLSGRGRQCQGTSQNLGRFYGVEQTVAVGT